MDSILFILSLLTLALVAGWYVGNEAKKASGTWGFLSIAAPLEHDETKAGGPRYRASARRARGRREQTVLEKAAAAAPQTERYVEKGPRVFTDNDDSRYRSRGSPPLASDIVKPKDVS